MFSGNPSAPRYPSWLFARGFEVSSATWGPDSWPADVVPGARDPRSVFFFLRFSLGLFAARHDPAGVSFFFANKPRAPGPDNTMCCQLVRDIAPPRCQMSFFSRESSPRAVYLYLARYCPKIRSSFTFHSPIPLPRVVLRRESARREQIYFCETFRAFLYPETTRQTPPRNFYRGRGQRFRRFQGQGSPTFRVKALSPLCAPLVAFRLPMVLETLF